MSQAEWSSILIVRLAHVFATTTSTTSLCTLCSWLAAKLNIPKLYKHINLLTWEKIVQSSFQVPHRCMFSNIGQMMVSNCKWFNPLCQFISNSCSIICTCPRSFPHHSSSYRHSSYLCWFHCSGQQHALRCGQRHSSRPIQEPALGVV